MQEIYFAADTGETIAFGPYPPYLIGSIRGLGVPNAVIDSYAAPTLDGEVMTHIRYPPREITFDMHIYGKTRADMYQNRRRLEYMFSSRQPGSLDYINDTGQGYHIKAIARELSVLERIQTYNKAQVTFWCPDPLFQGVTGSAVLGDCGAPFTLPTAFNPTITFGGWIGSARIQNFGDIAAPVKITVQGPCANPIVINATTGKKISVGVTLTEGDSLVINTERGQKTVNIYKADGSAVDGYSLLDWSSEYWELARGHNVILYQANEKTGVCTIEWRERLAGV